MCDFICLERDVIGVLGRFVLLWVFGELAVAEEALEVGVLLEGVEEVGEVRVVGSVEGRSHLVLEQPQSGLVRVDLLLLQEVVATGSHPIIIRFNNTNQLTT